MIQYIHSYLASYDVPFLDDSINTNIIPLIQAVESVTWLLFPNFRLL